MDTLEKLDYRIKAGIKEAEAEKEKRLKDRIKLPLQGLNGEKLYLTGIEYLNIRVNELKEIYINVPASQRVSSVILLDAHASATIEGARTTVERMQHCLQAPETKDEIMVANTFKGCMYAYEHKIDGNNIRELWDIIVENVFDNEKSAGTFYRNGMVYVGNANQVIHTPAKVSDIQKMMDSLFAFVNDTKLDPLIKSFVFHFYFIYVHPFCDGNGRTARTINSSQLYFDGFEKIKSIAMATAINRDITGYYKVISDCEKVIDKKKKEKWIDISPFVDYMFGIFEESMTDTALADNILTEPQKKILDKMNKVGLKAEITVSNAMKITKLSYSSTGRALNKLANDGYLTIDNSKRPYIYRLYPHL
ncbi:MAG: Fic family protein [Lachnospiraceae bacterium]|nr:Fic family protein [Lachnospiraceae bacterium]